LKNKEKDGAISLQTGSVPVSRPKPVKRNSGMGRRKGYDHKTIFTDDVYQDGFKS
jgi:hypothetical protein